jgi:hypothetical protein
MREKEKEIKMKEDELLQLNRRLSTCQKKFKDEHVKNEEIERALRQELDEEPFRRLLNSASLFSNCFCSSAMLSPQRAISTASLANF